MDLLVVSVFFFLSPLLSLGSSDRSHNGGGRRALAAMGLRFLECIDGDYAKLLRDWERD